MKIMVNGDSNTILADKAYVDYIAKQLEELIIDHINESNAHTPLYKKQPGHNIDKLSYDAKDLELDKVINANDISEDSNHRFVSDYQIDVFNSKPSIEEVVHRAEIMDDEVIKSINTKIDKLINSPYSLNKLKELSRFLRDDINMDKFMNELSMKLDAEDFISHLRSDNHISSTDRIALKKLIELSAGIDWNSDIIKNKPKSLPANGGNADTLSGYKVEDIINRQHEDYIVGSDDKCDIKLTNDTMLSMEDASLYPLIKFKSGKYFIDRMILKNNTLIGSGKHNCFINANNITINSSFISHIKFTDSNIRIYDNTEIENCEFANSSISLVGEQCIVIKNCTFRGSELKYENILNNSIIINNIFDYAFTKFLGGNNIIKDNITR